MSAGVVSGGVGTITLQSPSKNKVMYTTVGAGVGFGWSVKYGVSASAESFTSRGNIFVLDSFAGAELRQEDIEGFYFSRDASAALGVGISGSAMLIGIPPSSLPDEVMVQILRASDFAADAAIARFGHPRLFRILLRPIGVTIFEKIFGRISPTTFASKAKALLLTGGQTIGGVGAGVSETFGYMWAPNSPRLEPPPGQWTPNVVVPTIERVTTRSALPSQDAADVIRLPGDALFAFDRYDIRPDADAVLRRVAQLIGKKPPRALSVEGHTDAIGLEGYNQALSMRRAQTVGHWLTSHKVVKPSAISFKGWGKMRPIAPNSRSDGSDNPEGRQKNRRVEIWLIR